jgi:hypothetical protein
MRLRSWHGALVAVLASAACALCAPSAQSFQNNWNCTRAAYNHCTDPDTSYHTWIETVSGTTNHEIVNLCTKAVTAPPGNNVRSTTANPPVHEWCGFNTTSVGRCLISSTPNSRAYSYWGSGGGQVKMVNGAYTPSSSGC